jgi:acyl CoA:acetate/3-ketoacid CoA transferase beta subunit
VHRIITERVVLDVTPEGLKVVELLPPWTRQQVEGSTEARLVW